MNSMPNSAEILPFPQGGASKHRPETPPPLMSAVMDLIDARGGGEGLFETGMPGVNLMRSFQTIMPIPNMYRPSLCVVLKGAKEIHFGDTTLRYSEMECLVVSVAIPAIGRMVGATRARPYVGMTIEFDPAILREVIQQLAAPPQPCATSRPFVFVGKVDEPLTDCLTRLIRLMQRAEAIPVLFPSLMRELHYWLLAGPYGADIAKLALPETHSERVAKAINFVRENLNQPMRVEQLAEVAGMSPSSFHHHFKTMTSMTPVQYQKQLRLLEARRLMLSDAANVSEAAYQVGYQSASQFSREYTRTFGVAPKRDVLSLKALLEQAMPR